ncbi:rhodanese-like domain-containing protein [uncultured Winogradskyella sp.]|uniref:rhodanese-like domain-containing protein n=1 Tax=uncultured Winogradskyella sp. TaxID=395353 RepID=UPI00261DB077|nr:rhodanese-like domain-containing protein [uncultured Winogradskyella sp.]
MSFLSVLFGSNTQQNSSVRVLSAEEFKTHIENKNVQLIDVRTPREFKSGHIKGAKNIDAFSGNFNVEFNKLNKEKAVFVYCRSGSRSRQSANKLARMGFTEIYDLKGGILRYS